MKSGTSGTAPGAEALALAWDPGQPAMAPSFLGLGQGLCQLEKWTMSP